MQRKYYVYFIANKRNNVLYVGVTNNILRRVWEHKLGINEGFTRKYKVKKLVYYEVFDRPWKAIQKEKYYKNWNSKWKWDLAHKHNPYLKDLFFGLS